MNILLALAALATTGPVKPPVPNLQWGQAYPAKPPYKQIKSDSPDIQRFETPQGAHMFAKFTPKTRKLWGVVFLYASSQDNFQSYLNNYQDYYKALTGKYGEPSSSFDFASYPYDNGQEEVAHSLGKYTLAAYWMNFTQTVLSISLTPEGLARISYESVQFSAIDDQERAQMREDSI